MNGSDRTFVPRRGSARFASSLGGSDTPQNFEAFGNVLVPILGALGVDVGRPEVIEVHNVIRG